MHAQRPLGHSASTIPRGAMRALLALGRRRAPLAPARRALPDGSDPKPRLYTAEGPLHPWDAPIWPAYDELVTARRRAELVTPFVDQLVAGVTFEGRQALLARLKQGQPVLAVREPYNKFDAGAVRIETPSGEQLGYIPRTATSAFKHEVSSGFVDSLGRANGTGPWGAQVVVWPALRGVTLDFLPPSWGEIEDLPQLAGRYPALCASALAAAGGACQVTGAAASAALPLVAVPSLRFNPVARAVTLGAFYAAAAPVAAAARLDRIQGPTERRAALALVAGLNRGWSDATLDGHLRRAAARRDLMEREQWSFEVALTDQLLEAVP
ncbi:MAG: hypothetical protein J3K34DRAFT_442569 [Monoraphidium minutum]|nr:MAG: hypothetical protein J3K34DRAFT_442569 [Monoraphidium minutum]